MRMGKGYFWKSRGKRTTASHCSPSLPDRRPTQSTAKLSATAAPAGPRPTPQPRAPSAPVLTLVQLHKGGVGVQLLLAIPRVRQERLHARRHREPRGRPTRVRGRPPATTAQRHPRARPPAHTAEPAPPPRNRPRCGRGLGTPPFFHRQSERREGGAARSCCPMRERRCVWRVGRWREFGTAPPVRGLLAMLCRAVLRRAAGHREYRVYRALGASVRGVRTAVGSGECGTRALGLPDRRVRCSHGPLVSFQVSLHRFPCSISWTAISAAEKMITSPTEKSECPSLPSAAAFLQVRPRAGMSRCVGSSVHSFLLNVSRSFGRVWCSCELVTGNVCLHVLHAESWGPLGQNSGVLYSGCAMGLLQNRRLSQIAKDP